MDDAPALDTLFDRLERAWSAKDVDGLVDLFTEDCVYEDLALGAGIGGRRAAVRGQVQDEVDALAERRDRLRLAEVDRAIAVVPVRQGGFRSGEDQFRFGSQRPGHQSPQGLVRPGDQHSLHQG